VPKTTSIQFDHVACGVHRVDEIAPLIERELGARPHRGGPGLGFRGGQWSFGGEGRLELIEPDGAPGGFLHRFLAGHGPGIHHVTFKVPDIHAARDRAVALGFDVIGFSDESVAWKECFLHPKQAGGIVVQMAEVDPDSDDDNWVPFEAFTTGTPVRVVTLRGLRLVSRDEARTRRLFVELLGATSSAIHAAGAPLPGHTLRWEGSPLELHVILDPKAEMEGPVALEFDSFGAEFPSELPSLLGATLLQLES